MNVLILSTLLIDLGRSLQSYRYIVESSIEAALDAGMEVTVLHFGSPIERFQEDVKRVSLRYANKFSPSSLFLRYKFLQKAFSLARSHDVVYIHNSSDMFNAPIVSAARIAVIHYHDLVQDLLKAMFPIFGAPLAALYEIDTRLSKGSIALATSDVIARRLRAYGYKEVRLAYNRFGRVKPRESELSDFIKEQRRPVFVYVGTIQPKIKGLEEIDKIVGKVGGTLVLIGKKEANLRLKNAVYYGQVPTLEELIGGIRHGDFGVIGKIPSYILSTKVFDYIQAGLPILTHAKNSAIVEFLSRIGRPYIAYRSYKDVSREDIEGVRRKDPDEITLPPTCKESIESLFRDIVDRTRTPRPESP